VAVGSQVSAQLAVVGASLPDDAEVLVPEDDFASVVFPFLVHRDRGVTVRQVPLARLAEEIRPSTTMVAFSLAQSADGRLADLAAVQDAARAHGALTVCDTTQAVGWLPVAASELDVSVCAAYKWLSCPRGVSFLTVRPAVWERLRPVAAGWYAGESVWDSIYGPEMVLATDARRFDVSPAWLAWVGAAPVLELFADAEPSARAAGVVLAARVRAGLGMPETSSPVVPLTDPTGELSRRLRAAGCAFATRSGRIRLAFHVWNDDRDADLVLSACAS
jgi:selenocysteine lyase/cysteine desulfurase